MPECLGESADDLKAEALPESDRSFIGAHDKVELHRFELALARTVKGVCAHGASYPSACSPWCSDVSAVGNMRSSAELVRAEKVRADESVVIYGDEHLVCGFEPEGKGVFAGHLGRERVGLCRADGGFEDGPECVAIGWGCGANVHASLWQSRGLTVKWRRAREGLEASFARELGLC